MLGSISDVFMPLVMDPFRIMLGTIITFPTLSPFEPYHFPNLTTFPSLSPFWKVAVTCHCYDRITLQFSKGAVASECGPIKREQMRSPVQPDHLSNFITFPTLSPFKSYHPSNLITFQTLSPFQPYHLPNLSLSQPYHFPTKPCQR